MPNPTKPGQPPGDPPPVNCVTAVSGTQNQILPSAADLDADAEEKKIAALTADPYENAFVNFALAYDAFTKAVSVYLETRKEKP
jgi:hypothetical protein